MRQCDQEPPTVKEPFTPLRRSSWQSHHSDPEDEFYRCFYTSPGTNSKGAPDNTFLNIKQEEKLWKSLEDLSNVCYQEKEGRRRERQMNSLKAKSLTLTGKKRTIHATKKSTGSANSLLGAKIVSTIISWQRSMYFHTHCYSSFFHLLFVFLFKPTSESSYSYIYTMYLY